GDGRTLYVDAEAWEVGCELDKTPDLFDRIEGSRKWTITAASARPETVSYMRRKGFLFLLVFLSFRLAVTALYKSGNRTGNGKTN
ncbi:hypothetical protein, partial [Corynebacterium diphtheriae]|uniref:hypothetical protein n=1 Tax=Corynebacterium diphtheriae TaxID=1717 RepID=UPI000D46383B